MISLLQRRKLKTGRISNLPKVMQLSTMLIGEILETNVKWQQWLFLGMGLQIALNFFMCFSVFPKQIHITLVIRKKTHKPLLKRTKAAVLKRPRIRVSQN